MKIDIVKLGEKLTPCYTDENGNLISVIGFNSENVAEIKEAADDIDIDDWCVARISKEGDIEVIEFFKDADAAEKALHAICKKNGWTLREN